MTRTLHYLRWAVNVLLGFGCFLVLNENPETFTPNLIGLGCAALLIFLNKDKDERIN